MYRKFIITFLILFTPIAFFEQHKNDKGSYLEIDSIDKFNRIEKNNLKEVDFSFDANESNTVEIKNCWEEEDLASQKRYCLSSEKLFHNF